jgi:hypothetical protein
MKTAMQELLGLVEQMFNNAKTIEVESAMNDVINIITQQGLEKEKEQIIEAWKNNREMIYYDIDKDELSETTKIELGKEYYNQTYNQTNNL